MANLDPFTAQIVEYVRRMPDEALLELVRAHLGGIELVQLPSGGAGRTSAEARRADPAKSSRKAKKRGAPRATTEQRKQLLQTIEQVVRKSRGLSSSEVAKKAKVPQSRAASALRELKGAKRIFQGGERRFARYAGDAKTANLASQRARKSASGPKRVK